jgi:hypothetical protein
MRQKRPTNLQKRPTNLQKRPTNLHTSAQGGRHTRVGFDTHARTRGAGSLDGRETRPVY